MIIQFAFFSWKDKTNNCKLNKRMCFIEVDCGFLDKNIKHHQLFINISSIGIIGYPDKG